MYEIMVKSSFSAAHRLRNYKGKCENLHGHNCKVEVTVSSDKLGKNGLLLDFKTLKNKLNSVLKKVDHTYLNKLPYFKKRNPTSENIAKFIHQMLKKSGIRPKQVSVWESDTSCATYIE